MFQPRKLSIIFNFFFFNHLTTSGFFPIIPVPLPKRLFHISVYTGDSLVLTKICQLHSINILRTCPHHFFKNIEASEATHTEISEGRNSTLIST